ncbi:zinc finger BED domain-containing protein 5-like [Tachypleus tridentatus]|uniref:zinc finger BED domain-containing protein 5-like n=1 Tax=Tachypleus tridentatus TaxID=6853 RepID=UPI003FCFDF85
MKPCKLKIHLEKKHTGEKDKPVEYFKKLRDDFQARKTVSQLFNNKVCKMSDGLLASYEISKIIAKAGKPHNVGETVILPAVSVIISSVMKQNASEITNCIPLSNSSVSRRIDEMAEDVEKQLIAHLQVKQFALQLDESTLRDNEAILLAYENNIPLKNIIACATDGAPSMTGRYKGFIAHLKKAVPEVFCIHYVIHRQHLVAKKMSARLHDALTVVIQVVNHIKSNSLRDRLLHELCKQNGEEFERLVLHTEVRWLSKGNCLQCFTALWYSIVSFLANTQLGEQLLANKCDVFFLSDIFEKLNSLNKQLQGKDSDLISSKSAIVAFLRKLQLYKNNIRRRAFEQFPCLASVSSDLLDEDLALYGEYMKNMHKDMQTRFSDLLMMVIPTWVSIPFEVNVTDIDISLQEPLIELQSDEIMRAKFKDGKYNVWKTNDVATKYPLLWDKAQLYVIAFPTSYLVELGFSRVSQLLSKARNRLDIVKRGDLRLSLTSMEPDIKKLAEQHQPQGSH